MTSSHESAKRVGVGALVTTKEDFMQDPLECTLSAVSVGVASDQESSATNIGHRRLKQAAARPSKRCIDEGNFSRSRSARRGQRAGDIVASKQVPQIRSLAFKDILMLLVLFDTPSDAKRVLHFR